MPKDESRSRKSREDLDFGPYTKHPTSRSGENFASTSNTGSTEELSAVVLGEGSGSASGSHLAHSRDTEMIPVGSSEPSQLQPVGSFFQMSRNVNVNGGEFNSSRLHHTTLTINIGRNDASGSGDSSIRETESEGRRDASRDSFRIQDDSGNNYHREGTSDSGYSRYRGGDTSHTHPEPRPLTSLPVQKSSDIYFRHLAAKGCGSPLWNPEPNNMLPIEYQRKGIGIGDVGIITHSGGFDFLFNICLPEGHPINPEQMPLNFKPLAYPEPRDVYVNMEFKPDSYLASSLVETSRRDGGESPGLVFESSAMDGAVLTMPAGSRSTDVRNVAAFRKYAIANVERWYQYANEVRGREARNGDLRLVVGYHLASSWGMAAFLNLSEQSAFRLKYTRPASRMTATAAESDDSSVQHSLAAGNRRAGYEWECSGTAVEVKSGPDPREIEALQPLGTGGSSGPDVYENQSLFIRTINVTLQDDVWNKLNAEWEIDIGVDGHAFSETERPSSTGAGGRLGGLAMGASDGAQNQTHTSEASGRERERRSVSDDIDMDNEARQDRDPTKMSFSRNGVHISYPPGALNLHLHPSTAINRCLLKARPNMRMAITEDNDWISVLHSDETVLPPSELLFYRILLRSSPEICDEDGAIFFGPSTPDPVYEPSTPPPPRKKRILEFPDNTYIFPPSTPPTPSTPSTPPTPAIPISKTIDPEDAYPTPLLYEHRRRRSSNVLSTDVSDFGRSGSVKTLAGSLNTRYHDFWDADESVSLHREALSLCPPSHPGHAVSLRNLADALTIRYSMLGNMKDLEDSISLYHETLNLLSPVHPDRVESLKRLADALSNRYNKLGDIKDLEDSISLHREALSLRPPGIYDAVILNDLADTLNTHYNKLGNAQDLQDSISLRRDAVNLDPAGHRQDPSDGYFPLPQRSESQPPSTPPPQPASLEALELARLLDAKTVYPTPETVPFHRRK